MAASPVWPVICFAPLTAASILATIWTARSKVSSGSSSRRLRMTSSRIPWTSRSLRLLSSSCPKVHGSASFRSSATKSFIASPSFCALQ
uniref:Putative secreted protein n=1 Tax=Ixodes ricinus TaxID=34613 RepID=A0A6B0UAI5_IXORI